MPVTKKEIHAKMGKLQEELRKLDETDIIKSWKNFTQLPIHEQMRIRREWDVYYVEVKESPIYHLVMEQRDALSSGHKFRVKELADEATRMKEDGAHITIAKPLSVDPFEYDHGATLKSYRHIQKKLKELANLDEYGDKDVSAIFT